MPLWKVHAGKYGEQETAALEHDLVAIGWNDLGDLSSVNSRDELEKLFRDTYTDKSDNSVANQVGQIWAFRSRIQVNDWVVVPLRQRSAIAIGIVQSGYVHRNDLGDTVTHTRRVKWIRTDMPRTSFDQDLLYSFGAFMTVCQITRNDAENRVKALLDDRRVVAGPLSATEAVDVAHPVDVEQLASDQIQEYISKKFRGHSLAQLVDAVLKAQGYVTHVSPPGPDGGVDILAGAGPMGFEAPRICVQVKSSSSPVEVGVLRELRGTMEAHHAEHGLLVSWGGFKSSVIREAATSYFKIRLWDQGQLLEHIATNYERLAESLQAELPLKRTWVLALEEEDS